MIRILFARTHFLAPSFLVFVGLGVIAVAIGVDASSVGPMQLQLASAGAAAIFGGLFLLTPPGRRFISGPLVFEPSSISARRHIARLLIISLLAALLVSLLEGISFLVLQIFPYFTLGLWVLAVGVAVLATPAGQRFIQRLFTHEKPAQSPGERLTRPLLIAIWFGLAAGLIEGAVFLTAQKFVHFDEGVWIQIAWIVSVQAHMRGACHGIPYEV